MNNKYKYVQCKFRHVYMNFRQNFSQKKKIFRHFRKKTLAETVNCIPKGLRKGNPFHGPFAQLSYTPLLLGWPSPNTGTKWEFRPQHLWNNNVNNVASQESQIPHRRPSGPNVPVILLATEIPESHRKRHANVWALSWSCSFALISDSSSSKWSNIPFNFTWHEDLPTKVFHLKIRITIPE